MATVVAAESKMKIRRHRWRGHGGNAYLGRSLLDVLEQLVGLFVTQGLKIVRDVLEEAQTFLRVPKVRVGEN